MSAASVLVPAARRERLRVRGVVQGVGFRPFVHALATELGLAGWVGNDTAGVVCEVEGDPGALAAFRARLVADAPRLAVVEGVEVAAVPAAGAPGFVIAASSSSTTGAAGAGIAMVPPDVAPCGACLAEVADPGDRRYRYPFGNCTDCGPRFTVVVATPYDRAATTMAGFALCGDCARERADPGDRRFHAEPLACPACGPVLSFEGPGGPPAARVRGEEALAAAQRLLAAGGVVAVKGLGGYHLACDARSAVAVAELRRRKARPDKPFALLVADVEAARELAVVDAVEAELLASPARPIVLLARRPGGPGVADAVAPGVGELGIALPSTLLHHLLLAPPGATGAIGGLRPVLVLTSGNLVDEPIAYDDADARERLAPLVDGVLAHDRPIHLPCDDSVLRVVDGAAVPLRRSRGYVPAAVRLPGAVRLPAAVRPVLALGGDLKATACLAAGGSAWVGQHIGDVESPAGLAALERSARHLVALLRVRPEVVACDLHPGYHSARLARRLAQELQVPLVPVQHHHAHVASALADAGLDEPAVGVALDGTGHGTDGTTWGGEVLVVDGSPTARRVAHLAPVLLPGGDAAARRPARSALAHLHAAGVAWEGDLAPVAACTPVELSVVRRQLETGFGAVPTSSAGRLFDAVASLCGVRQDATYEAQAAMELEALARGVDPGPDLGTYAFALRPSPERVLVADAAPVVRAVVAELRAGVAPALVAARSTAALADAVVELAARACDAEGLDVVALTGGVFANAALLRRAGDGLRARGLRVAVHRQVPAGDGGLSLGQAVVARRHP